MHKLTAYIEKDPETNLLVAVVPGVPGRIPKRKRLMNCDIICKRFLSYALRKWIPKAAILSLSS